MTRSPHPPLVAAVLCATLGCGAETAPQLVAGLAAGAKGHATAWAGERRAAHARLDEEGRFLLALPPGATYRLEIEVDGTSATPLLDVATGAMLLVEVCAAEALLDLGTLSPAPTCLPHLCAEARVALDECLRSCEVALDCPAALERDCRAAPDPDGCAAAHPCADPAKSCASERCAGQSGQLEVACAPSAEADCDPGALAWIAERPAPTSLGCAPARGTR